MLSAPRPLEVRATDYFFLVYWLIPVGLLLREPLPWLPELLELLELLEPLELEEFDKFDEVVPLLAVPREVVDSDFVLLLLVFMAVYTLVLYIIGLRPARLLRDIRHYASTGSRASS